MTYYRIYRPQTIADIDKVEIRERLKRFLSQESPPHAFLFSGPKGIGKTSAARIVAKSVNCTRHVIGGCGTCDTCRAISGGEFLDVLEIDAASNRGIDDIRSLKEGIRLAPFSGMYKVYIIDEVHMLTTEAFNALLKTLEEPPANTVFVLATTEPQKLPDTIISRCVHVQFTKATSDEIVQSLRRIATAENLHATDEVLALMVAHVGGSFRDAAKLLEQVALDDKTITEERIKAAVGATDHSDVAAFVTGLKAKDIAQLFGVIEELEKNDRDVRLFVKQLLETFHALLRESVTSGTSEWTFAEIRRVLTIFSNNWEQYKGALIASLPLELATIEYCFADRQSLPNKKIDVTTSTDMSDSPKSTEADGSADEVVKRWSEILEALKSHNHSIVGVLRSCKPVSLSKGVLTVESPYKFHTERLSDAAVQKALAEVIYNIVGLKVSVKPVLRK